MGRPSGALSGGTRRRYPQDWELRDPRFEELESEDEDGQGVILDPNSFAAREARARGYRDDDLYFDGYDGGPDRYYRYGMYDTYGDEYEARQVGYRDQEGMAYQAAVREKEEALIQSALKRIKRAREKKSGTVKLSVEEAEAMEAFERRNVQQPEPPKPPLASPPATPAKSTPKAKVSSRSNSSSNLAGKTRKRNSGLFGSTPSPAKSNSKAKVNRKSSDENAAAYPTGQSPYGPMIVAPNGTLVPAHMAYGPPSPEHTRSQPGSRSGSRSASKHSRRDSTPPERTEYYQHPIRYQLPPPGLRPESSGSNRSLPDDPDWAPPTGRHRSTSNVQYTGYATDYDLPPALPAAQSRRNISGGPSDYRYLRRVPPSSPLAHRPVPAHSSCSDPAVVGRQSSGLSQELESSTSSSSSDDEQGVQVEVSADANAATGYSINRLSEPQPVNEGRKRRSERDRPGRRR